MKDAVLEANPWTDLERVIVILKLVLKLLEQGQTTKPYRGYSGVGGVKAFHRRGPRT